MMSSVNKLTEGQIRARKLLICTTLRDRGSLGDESAAMGLDRSALASWARVNLPEVFVEGRGLQVDEQRRNLAVLWLSRNSVRSDMSPNLPITANRLQRHCSRFFTATRSYCGAPIESGNFCSDCAPVMAEPVPFASHLAGLE